MDKTEFEKYIKERYQKQIEWYDTKSVYNKRIYQILQVISIIFTIITPITIAIELTVKDLETSHQFAIVSLVFAVIVAISSSIMRTFRYHDNWLNYREICETLKSEIHLYNSRAGNYANENPEALFVVRIESIISSEKRSWISASMENKKTQEVEQI